jgi:hypothetical protein
MPDPFGIQAFSSTIGKKSDGSSMMPSPFPYFAVFVLFGGVDGCPDKSSK